MYSPGLVCEFERDLGHGLRLGALLRGRIPEGTLLLPPKRLPLLEKEGRKNLLPPYNAASGRGKNQHGHRTNPQSIAKEAEAHQ